MLILALKHILLPTLEAYKNQGHDAPVGVLTLKARTSLIYSYSIVIGRSHLPHLIGLLKHVTDDTIPDGNLHG